MAHATPPGLTKESCDRTCARRILGNPNPTFPNGAVGIMIISYVAVEQLKVPPPATVVGGGALGVIAWATGAY